MQRSKTSGDKENADVDDLLRRMEDLTKNNLDVSRLDRKSSALIATASIMVNVHDFDIESVELDMPVVVQGNLNEMLLPYFNAVKLDGYQTHKTRKVFVIGNTGMSFYKKNQLKLFPSSTLKFLPPLPSSWEKMFRSI